MVKKVIVSDIRNDITKGGHAASLINDIKRAVNEVITFGVIPEITILTEPAVDLFELAIGDYSITSPSVWNSALNKPVGVVSKTAFIQVRRLKDDDASSPLVRLLVVIEDNDVYCSTKLSDLTNNPWVKYLNSGNFTPDSNGVLHSGAVTAANQTVGNTDVRLSNAREWVASVISKSVAENGSSTDVGKWSPNIIWEGINGWFSGNTVTDPITNVVYKGSIPAGKNVVTVDDVRLTNATTSKSGIMASSDKLKLNNIEVGAQVNPAPATPSSNGLFSKEDKTKLNGIETGAQVNPPPVTQLSDGLMLGLDKIKLDSIQVGAQVNPSVATTTTDGLMDKTDKSKLDSIETGAQVNPPLATIFNDGLLSSADKVKLDSIDGSAKSLFIWGNDIVGDTTFDEIDRGNTFLVESDCTITLPLWSTTIDGWYVRLILNHSTVNSVGINSQGLDEIIGDVGDMKGNLLIVRSPVEGEWVVQVNGEGAVEEAPIDGKQYARKDAAWEEFVVPTNDVTSVSGKTGDVTLDKADVGLSNVDNTSDINKPISNSTQSALNNKVDKQAGKGLSDTNFTQAEKDKLSYLESSKFIGLFVSETALPLSGSDGDYANVDGGVGSDVYRVIWDSSDNKWVRAQGVSTELTDAQIKQQYESNPNTNAFTDDEKSKLANIDNGATANRADILNADKIHTHAISDVTGLSSRLNDIDVLIGDVESALIVINGEP